MAFSGGVFSRIYSWISDANSNIPITASRMDAEMDGMATGLSTCILKDGTQVITADLPMAGFKHTNVGAATARNQYATVAGSQDNSYIWAGTAGGTANAITISTSPVTTTLVTGRSLKFISSAANTGAVTIAENGLTAKAITKNGATALIAGDIPSGALVVITYDGTQYQLESAIAIPSVVSVPQGRLSLTTAAPVMASDVAGATTIYWVPYKGQTVPLYNGTNFTITDTGGQLSNITSNAATGKAGPAAVTTNSNYDLFIWNDSGTIRLTRGPLWTSDTARGTGAGTTELITVQGVYLNANAITNGPALQRGTYIGSVRSNGTSTIDVKFGATPTSGGSSAICGIWNNYNRINATFSSYESDNSWVYTTFNYRPYNGAAANLNNRVAFITGQTEDTAIADFYGMGSQSSGTSTFAIGLALDSTTVPSGSPQTFIPGTSATVASAHYRAQPSAGYHFFQALEAGNTNGSFYGDNNSPTLYQSSLQVSWVY